MPFKVSQLGCISSSQLTMMDTLNLVGWLKEGKRWLLVVKTSRNKLWEFGDRFALLIV